MNGANHALAEHQLHLGLDAVRVSARVGHVATPHGDRVTVTLTPSNAEALAAVLSVCAKAVEDVRAGSVSGRHRANGVRA
jgi:hypothetical protein